MSKLLLDDEEEVEEVVDAKKPTVPTTPKGRKQQVGEVPELQKEVKKLNKLLVSVREENKRLNGEMQKQSETIKGLEDLNGVLQKELSARDTIPTIDQIESELMELRAEINRLKERQVSTTVTSDEMHAKIRELRQNLAQVPPHRRKILVALDDYTGKKNNKYTAIGEGYRYVCNEVLREK